MDYHSESLLDQGDGLWETTFDFVKEHKNVFVWTGIIVGIILVVMLVIYIIRRFTDRRISVSDIEDGKWFYIRSNNNDEWGLCVRNGTVMIDEYKEEDIFAWKVNSYGNIINKATGDSHALKLQQSAANRIGALVRITEINQNHESNQFKIDSNPGMIKVEGTYDFLAIGTHRRQGLEGEIISKKINNKDKGLKWTFIKYVEE